MAKIIKNLFKSLTRTNIKLKFYGLVILSVFYVAYINFNYGFFNKLYYHVNKSVFVKLSLSNTILNPEIEKLKKKSFLLMRN